MILSSPSFNLRLGVVAALLTVLLSGCGQRAAKPPAQPSPPAVKKLAVPKNGAYTGAYIDFGDREDNVTLEGIEDFEQKVGKHQAIVAFSSYWGENNFPDGAARVVTQHGSVPLVFWSPWDWPYREEQVEIHGPDRFRLDGILAGNWNEYIDRWADSAKALSAPMFVSFCNEANGSWFPWSAIFYGGKEPVPGSDPARFQGPETFKRAYRYVVDRVRARGATNILWVLHLNNFSDPYENWNALAQFYPGDDYVDWLGLSVYGQMYPDDPKWETFQGMLKTPYDELCNLHPTKPVMVTEWGVGEFPTRGDKGAWIASGFEEIRKDYPRVRAEVYWHERWQNNKKSGVDQAPFFSNLKVDSSPGALAAYRRGVSDSYWLGTPVFEAQKTAR